MNNYKKLLLESFKNINYYSKQTYSVNDLLKNKKIILYGAGDGFITFKTFVLRKYRLKVDAILDLKFKTGDIYFGIPAFSPLEYKPTQQEKENAIVIITVGKKKYHKEILTCLSKLGFKHIIFSTDIYEYHLLCIPKELEKNGIVYYLDNKKKIISCLDTFSDDLSREIFIRVIQTHLQKKPLTIPSRHKGERYFPRDINLNKGYTCFINCGAYNGDTLMRLNTLVGKIDTVVCFEPDPENFKLLTQYLSTHYKKIANNIIVFPCGVFSQETKMPFMANNKMNSMILEKGKYYIQCVSLDHTLISFNPTFISMDVEGMELEALKGAQILIKKNKPDLAISVYHNPSHIWEIPIYIKNLNSKYKLYLRNYTSFISETILYATT